MNRRVWVALALFLSLFTPAAAQVKGPITLSVDVPSGKWKTLRLHNVPTGALVAVEVQTNQDVVVAFVDGAEYRRYPAVQRPLFSGRVEKHISFSVTTAAAGDYFLVFDNLSGREPRAVTVKVSASRGTQRVPTQETQHPRLAPIRLRHAPPDHSGTLITRKAEACPLS
jgi:hypothetical protein